uniref:30S ribosomal protein S11 n=1 Tax=Nephromyces sp. ex Molgula occidentalis TaxID=2544991 RepID=A0A5C1H7U3_9APIC|nr:30S ribosomal protein S11 [Nephromyces sp. ex Molgula occidentalis]
MNNSENFKKLNLLIQSSQKNIFINLIDNKSNLVLTTYSFGTFKFKTNQKKNITLFIKNLIFKFKFYILKKNYNFINIIFKGSMYLKRKLILKLLISNFYNFSNIKFISIKDFTSFPFNGCRLKKIKK